MMNLKRFPFSSSSVQMDGDLKTGLLQTAKCLKVGFYSSMWLGCSGCLGWCLFWFSWCWCRRAKITSLMRFHLWQCGTSPGGCNLHLTKKKMGLCLIIYAWCSNCLARIHLLLVMFWGSFCKYLPDWSTTSSIQLLVESCTNWSEDFASWLVNVTGARKR